jgi:hypothetical protein
MTTLHRGSTARWIRPARDAKAVPPCKSSPHPGQSMPQLGVTAWPVLGASISPWTSISRGLGCQTTWGIQPHASSQCLDVSSVSKGCHRSSIRPLTRTGRAEQSGPCKSKLLVRPGHPSRKLARHSSQGVRQGSAAYENRCGRPGRLGDRCGRCSVHVAAMQIAQQSMPKVSLAVTVAEHIGYSLQRLLTKRLISRS